MQRPVRRACSSSNEGKLGQRTSNLHIICKNSPSNAAKPESDRRTRQLERRQDRDLQRAEAPRLLRGKQLAAAGAEGLQLRYGTICQKNGVSASKADK